MSKQFDQVEAFARVTARHDRIWRVGMFFLVLCGVLLAVASLVDSDDFQLGLLAFAIIAFVVGSVAALCTPRLRCPACSGRIDAGNGTYCPQCGYATLVPHPKWAGWARCTTCNIDIVTVPETRYHKIHSCTHCGCLLDPVGR